LTADNAGQQQRLYRAQAEVDRQSNSWIASSPASAEARGRLAAPDRRGEGAAIMEAVRARSASSTEEKPAPRAAQRRRDPERRRAVAGVAVFTLGISLVLGVAVFYFIRREIAVREQNRATENHRAAPRVE